MGFKVAPLNANFMATSILGFILSLVFVFPEYPDWGFAFALTFFIMFLASLVSMTYAPVDLVDKKLFENSGKESARKVKGRKRKR